MQYLTYEQMWRTLEGTRRNGKATARRIYIGWTMDGLCVLMNRRRNATSWINREIRHAIVNPSFL